MKFKEFRNVTIRIEKHGHRVFAYIKRKKGVTRMKMSNFKKMTMSLEKKGKGMGAEEAKAVAAKIGREKYGAKGMAKKAALGRKRAEERRKNA